MGKVIIFNGVTVNNSIGNISLINSLPKNLTTYFSLSNITPTVEENNAFLSFYKTLKSNNLWDSIAVFHPMFKNLDGCKYSVVGNTLTLPNGCVYNKGLDCTNASEGKGFLKKGFLLNDTGVLSTGNFSIYFAAPIIDMRKIALFTALDKNDLSGNTHDLSQSKYFNFGLSLNNDKTISNLVGFNAESYGKDVSNNRVFCYTHKYDTKAEGKLYSDGIVGENIGKTFSASSLPIYFNVFSATDILPDNSRWNANTAISFIMIYKETHSKEQVKIISDAINEIISKIQS